MKTHSFDAVSFFSGLVISAIGVVFLVAGEPGDIFGFLGDVGAWFWPVLLLIIGLAVLVPALTSSRSNDEDGGIS